MSPGTGMKEVLVPHTCRCSLLNANPGWLRAVATREKVISAPQSLLVRDSSLDIERRERRLTQQKLRASRPRGRSDRPKTRNASVRASHKVDTLTH